MKRGAPIISHDKTILITGANGFIGTRVVESLLKYGFRNLRCFVRTSSNVDRLKRMIQPFRDKNITFTEGNLLSLDDCRIATQKVSLIYHLAAGMEKDFQGAFLNSVVTTRNLLDASLQHNTLKRFLNVSSFTVYSTANLPSGALLDESCEVHSDPELKGEAYCYAKVKQEELILEYSAKHKIPFAIVRPGVVYGPGNTTITGRVGISVFGLFLHLGGSNKIPFTYVDNCADAIVLAGLTSGVDGECFNIVDDELPTSREFLKQYKRHVGRFMSFYIPKSLSYFLCFIWEKCSAMSIGALPPRLNRVRWSDDWKGDRYSNEKAKRLLGWNPKVRLDTGMKRYFEYCGKAGGTH